MVIRGLLTMVLPLPWITGSGCGMWAQELWPTGLVALGQILNHWIARKVLPHILESVLCVSVFHMKL